MEIGVGLIACNLPSLSVRTANALPRQIRRGWNLSLSGLRRAAERLSLRSDPRKSYPDVNRTRDVDEGTAEDWYNSRHRSKRLEQSPSGPTVSHIPLVHLGANSNKGVDNTVAAYRTYLSEPTENANEKVIGGFDVV